MSMTRTNSSPTKGRLRLKSRSVLARILENWPAKVLSVTVAVLLTVFNSFARLEERSITVPLSVVLNEEYVPAAAHIEKVRVVVRGEPDAIDRVSDTDVEAFVDLSPYRSDGVHRATVSIARRGGALEENHLEIRVEPLEIEVALERRLVRRVPVEPVLFGVPPAGYEIASTRVTPPSIEIDGPHSRVEFITAVETEQIDMSSRTEEFATRVGLVNPDPFVAFRGGDTVEFRAQIDERIALATFDSVEIVVLDLDPDLIVLAPLPVGSVRVQARELDIERYQSTDLQIIIDAQGVDGPGTYTLPTRPDVPPGFAVLRFEPTEIDLVVGDGAGP